jgi:predicted aldo/keto reductase-like oxidoreductase
LPYKNNINITIITTTTTTTTTTTNLMANETSILSKCTQCGKCEKKCPQHIKIIQELKNVDKLMNKWYYRVLMKIVKAIMYR